MKKTSRTLHLKKVLGPLKTNFYGFFWVPRGRKKGSKLAFKLGNGGLFGILKALKTKSRRQIKIGENSFVFFEFIETKKKLSRILFFRLNRYFWRTQGLIKFYVHVLLSKIWYLFWGIYKMFTVSLFIILFLLKACFIFFTYWQTKNNYFGSKIFLWEN